MDQDGLGLTDAWEPWGDSALADLENPTIGSEAASPDIGIDLPEVPQSVRQATRAVEQLVPAQIRGQQGPIWMAALVGAVVGTLMSGPGITRKGVAIGAGAAAGILAVLLLAKR